MYYFFNSLLYHSKIIVVFPYFSQLQCSAAPYTYMFFPNFSPLSTGAAVHVLFVRSSLCSQNVRSGKYSKRTRSRRPPGRPPSSSPWAWARRRRRSSCSTRTFFSFLWPFYKSHELAKSQHLLAEGSRGYSASRTLPTTTLIYINVKHFHEKNHSSKKKKKYCEKSAK